MFLCLLFITVSLFSSPSFQTKAGPPAVHQSPAVIQQQRLNSTAEIHCSSTFPNPHVLYLKQRYSNNRQLLHLSITSNTVTVHPELKHRLSLLGSCCTFTLRLAQLQRSDTGGYHCQWLFNQDKLQPIYRHADETIIIVRDGGPDKGCNQWRSAENLLLKISIALAVTTALICTGALIRKLQQTRHYSPSVVHYRRRRCPHHQ